MGGIEPPSSHSLQFRHLGTKSLCRFMPIYQLKIHGNIKSPHNRSHAGSHINHLVLYKSHILNTFNFAMILPVLILIALPGICFTLYFCIHDATGLLWNGLGSTPRPTSHDVFASTRSDYILRLFQRRSFISRLSSGYVLLEGCRLAVSEYPRFQSRRSVLESWKCVEG